MRTKDKIQEARYLLSLVEAASVSDPNTRYLFSSAFVCARSVPLVMITEGTRLARDEFPDWWAEAKTQMSYGRLGFEEIRDARNDFLKTGNSPITQLATLDLSNIPKAIRPDASILFDASLFPSSRSLISLNIQNKMPKTHVKGEMLEDFLGMPDIEIESHEKNRDDIAAYGILQLSETMKKAKGLVMIDEFYVNGDEAPFTKDELVGELSHWLDEHSREWGLFFQDVIVPKGTLDLFNLPEGFEK